MMNITFLFFKNWMEAYLETNKLWTNVLLTKYASRGRGLERIKAKKGTSNAWQGITKTLPILENGTRTLVRGGNETKF